MAEDQQGFRMEAETTSRPPLGSAALIGTGLSALVSALSTSLISVVVIIIVLLLTLHTQGSFAN
jgi:hypothetical protein